MNSTRYSISADSRRWWWPPAAAGAVATGAITAIVAIPTAAGHAIPDPYPYPGSGTGTEQLVQVHEPAGTGARPCFLARPRWNVALDGHQPVCGIVP